MTSLLKIATKRALNRFGAINKGTQIVNVLRDEMRRRSYNELDNSYKKFPRATTKWLKQKQRVIRGRDKARKGSGRSLLGKDYKRSDSPFKSSRATRRGNFTGQLVQSLDVKLTGYKQPSATGKGFFKFEFFINHGNSFRSKKELEGQLEGLKTLGYNYLGFKTLKTRELNRIRNIING